jgi:hypothetical protein
MVGTPLPFFIRGRRVGSVEQVSEHLRFFRGRLNLDECAERPAFEAVVALARDVDNCPSDEYQAKWNIWMRDCSELQDLHLWIGSGQTQIEEFSIQSDWSIEWRIMDTEFVV